MQKMLSLKRGLHLSLISASLIIIISYFLTLKLLAYFPIYTDEIAIRIWLSRSIMDFPWHINIIPSADHFKSYLPIIWYFPSMIEWFLHGCIDSLSTLRLMGVGLFLIMTIMLSYLLLYKTKKNIFNVIVGFGLVIACMNIGVLPVFLIINRPEQIILMGLIILLLIYYSNLKKTSHTKNITISLIIYYSCVSLMLYMHAKTLYLAPALILINYAITSNCKNKYPVFLNFILLGLLLSGNFLAWHNELAYREQPSVNAYMSSFNIDLSQLFSNTHFFISQLKQSALNSTQLLNKIVFNNITEVNYLPPLTSHFEAINIAFYFSFLTLLLYLVIALFVGYAKDLSKKNYLSPRLLLISILLSITAGSLLNLTKTWYDVGYFWAMIMIIFIAHLHETFNEISNQKSHQIIKLICFNYLIILSIFSLITFQLNYKTPLLTGYAGPGVSLIKFQYKKYQQLMKKVNQLCLNNEKSQGLVLDDYTYLYFKNTKYPLLITYVNNHTSSNQFPKFIKNNIISGIIARCSYIKSIPNIQDELIIKIEDICCYPKNKLQTL